MAPSLSRKILLQRAAALFDGGRHSVATELLRQLAVDSEDYLRPPPRESVALDWRILPPMAQSVESTA